MNVITDMASEERWSAFRQTALDHGIRSVLSLPVFVGDGSIGALNFYDRRAGHFGESAVETGTAFTGYVAIVAAYYEKADIADQLVQAVQSRATIEQAKGIIMASAGCSPDEAFELLRQQSQAENVKLRDIAAHLVAQQQRGPSSRDPRR